MNAQQRAGFFTEFFGMEYSDDAAAIVAADGFALNALTIRYGQVHARVADRAQGGDGAHQLGFQRVLVAGVLDELADAEAGVALHQLETEPAAVGEAGAGQLQARVVQVGLGHRDRAGGLVELERNLRGAQQVGGLGRGLRGRRGCSCSWI